MVVVVVGLVFTAKTTGTAATAAAADKENNQGEQEDRAEDDKKDMPPLKFRHAEALINIARFKAIFAFALKVIRACFSVT